VEKTPRNSLLGHVLAVFGQIFTSQRAGMGKTWIVPTIRAMSLIPKLESSRGAGLVQNRIQSKYHRFYTRPSGIRRNSTISPFGPWMARNLSFSVPVTLRDMASMGITYLAGRVTHCSERWTPDVAGGLAGTAHSSQTKPGMLPIPAARSRESRRMWEDGLQNCPVAVQSTSSKCRDC